MRKPSIRWSMAGLAIGGVAAGALMLWPTHEAPTMPTVHVTIQPDVPEKPGVSYLIVEYGDTRKIDIAPPVELHVAHTPTEAACKDMGGTYQARNQMCLNVDY